MSVTLHTSHGDLKIELFCEAVPKTAYNFIALCASHQYDGSVFHRNIPEFVIQGGAVPAPPPTFSKLPKNLPSTSVYGSLFEDEIRPTLTHHTRGIVSMANKGPGTNGSQFFICYKAAPHLDGKNTVFGKVIEGMDTTLELLERAPVDAKGRPTEGCRIESVTIHANPIANQ